MVFNMKSNKKVKKSVFIFVSIIVSLCLTGCATLQTDFEKAKQDAAKQGKGVFVYFSGDSWNSDSVTFENAVLNKGAFRHEIEKQYVYVKLDFASASTEENVNFEMEEKNLIRENYAVKQIPCVYLLTQEGYVKAVIPYVSTIATPADMLDEVAKCSENVTIVDGIAEKIRSTDGVDKVYAINELYEATPEKYRLVLSELIKSVLVLDPYNESGLLGKFELQSAYVNAIRRAKSQDLTGVENIFTDICKNGHLSADEKQRAYYTSAFVLSAMGCTDYDKIIDLLQLSYNASPSGENAKKVKEVMNSFNQMAFTVKIMSQEKKVVDENNIDAIGE